MKAQVSCPRCGGPVRAPGLWSSQWQCEQHGPVHPMQPVQQPSSEQLHAVAAQSAVPVWLPWPLPRGWLVTGVASAGDERTGARATAVACSGPAPLGGVGELVIVAEEPGVGLGAHFAGIEGPDPGVVSEQRPPDAKVQAAGHPTALWTTVGAPDRAVYVGEAAACWVWAVLWPESDGFLIIDDFVLIDLRSAGTGLEVPFGALSPRLGG
jgi:hypothetical protein